MITAEAVLKQFTYLAIIYTNFVDGSVQMRVESDMLSSDCLAVSHPDLAMLWPVQIISLFCWCKRRCVCSSMPPAAERLEAEHWPH